MTVDRVIDPSNPITERDGRTVMLTVPVRGQDGGRRSPMRYWSDDPDAAADVVSLITAAGFEPVHGGGLAASKNAGES
ncbi:hypothetical protein LTV02_21770 [Nocardia yamanashiensis]|uniref:hypothetical protein n=1 Tax=Nocardia yamanashiensis TaxID=209247 RepID=UPI001E42AE92|nr:hypothetical protein [Nocardia yamanashiensis]UGT38749.1 hypothetical protein LTV02_21770 [Nocardia yamanashiensis]